ncbi:MAG: metallophosphoesterase, partial [Duodenibacillus sp.]
EGNHEHYVDYAGWMKALPRLGVRMLANEGAVLTYRGARLILAGLTDPKAQVYERALPNLDKALAGLQPSEGPRLAVLLLSHQPKNARYYVGKADLMLSGHTHGGQVFIFAPWVWVMNSGFVRGLYTVENKEAGGEALTLYVNQGLYAWAGFALRLGTRGEITRVTLRRAQPSALD